MTLRGRTLTDWLLLCALLVGVVGMAAWQGWLWRVDHLLYDASLPLLSRQAPADIVIVAIDESSLARIGRWPWRRAVHATLLQKLARADVAVVGLDVILNESDTNDPSGETLLAEAIARHGRVILPVVPPPVGATRIGEGRPMPVFAGAAAGLGHIEMPIDADGIRRGLHLWAGGGVSPHPQLALAMLMLADPPHAAPYQPAATDDTTAPDKWRRGGWRYLRYAGPPGTYRTVSYVDVLTGAIGADQLRGALVLVGATAAGLGDLHATPMSRSGQPMAGVEIHANALDSLRAGDTMAWLGRAPVTMISALAVLLLLTGLLYLSPRAGLAWSAGVGLAAVAVGIAQLRWGQAWLPPSAILIGAALAYPLWSWRRLEAAQRFMDAELRLLHDTDPAATDASPVEQVLDPLDRRIAIIRAAAERQRVTQKAREDTVRFISHDIRSVLVSIITLIERAADRDGADRNLPRIGRYAQHALDLADDFSRLKKAEAVDPRTFREVDVAALAQEAADEVWPQAERKRIAIEIDDTGGRDALVLGDDSLLRRALTNLLGNAVKYSPPGTTVHVMLAEDGSWQEITVADEGYGIPVDQMDKLFTRHARVSRPGQPDEPGIGLGLVIVKTIVDRHGGGVAVESTPGAGSTFRIRLPRAASRHA